MADKSRTWFVTIQEENMKKAGLTKEGIMDPKSAADFIKDTWEKSAKGRRACVATCISANGLYHLHAALYGPPTTIKTVIKLMYDSHVEPAENKSVLLSYILKEGKYAESGEQVLYVVGKDGIESTQGKRSDIDIIKELIDEGKTPDEIMGANLRYRRYEKMINSEYDYQCRRNMPYKRKMKRIWHFGMYNSGIELVNDTLIKKYGQDKVFYAQYTGFGSLDTYTKMGNPPVLVVDNIDVDTKMQDLFQLLNEYTNTKIRCRYEDITPLWKEVHLISSYPIEKFVAVNGGRVDLVNRLLSKLDFIEYHYLKDATSHSYMIPSSKYEDFDALKKDIENNTIYGEIVDSEENNGNTALYS